MKNYAALILVLSSFGLVSSAFAESSAASLAAETPVAVASAAVKQLPAEAFGSLPDVTNMRISPDGKRLASIIRIDMNNVKGSAVQIVNLETGEKKYHYRVRISATHKDASTAILTRDIDSEKWRELWKYDVFSDDEVNPLGFGLDPNILYVSAYLNNFKAIFKVNLKDPELKKELVFSEPNGDVAGGLIYSSEHNVIGIACDDFANNITLDSSLAQRRCRVLV
jgi:mRNA-degrading endonuclease toxin of MazEF toxin-antitoxin module